MRLGIKPAEESLHAAQQIETNVSRLFKSVSDKGREASEMVRGGDWHHWFDQFIGAKWPKLRTAKKRLPKLIGIVGGVVS